MPLSQQLTSAPHFHVVASAPRAELVIIHGLAEYGERYRRIALEFARQGISTFAFDQRGHGKSPGLPTHVDRFDDLVSDAQTIVRNLTPQSFGRPVFVWGHSMGAIVAMLLAATDAPIGGLIVSSNSLEIFKGNKSPARPWFRLLSWLAPKSRIPLGLNPKKISRDEVVQHAYASDTSIPSTASIRLLVEFAMACNAAREAVARIDVPVLAIHGARDAIAPARGSEMFIERVGSPDKTLRLFPDALHEVHNEIEPDRSQFVELVSQWIIARSDWKNAFRAPSADARPS